MKIGNRISEIIKSLGISKTEFANTLKVTPAYISKLTNKGAIPSDRLLEDICEKFHVNEDWLRNGTGDMFCPVDRDVEIATFMRPLIDTTPFSIKDRIKKIRKEFDLTQQEFADRLGVKRGAIANYEIGRNEPTNAIVSLICREFNVNEEWLRNGTGSMFHRDTPALVRPLTTATSFSIKDRIKKLRKTLDLTQQEFADKIGSKRNTIAKYETGTNQPSYAIISLVCREFKVNEEWLRYGTGDMFKTAASSQEESITNASFSDNLSKMKDRIKEVRKELNFTQQKFAEKVGIQRNTVAMYEMGKTAPSNAIILSICREFSVNKEWLLNGIGNMFQTTNPTFAETIADAIPAVNSFDIKDRIKKVRKNFDLTQQEFANKIGISRGNIAAYEVGKNNPSDAVIGLICHEFNVSEEWLRYGTGEMFLSAASTCQKYVPCLPDKKNVHDFICLLARMSEAEWDVLGWDLFQVVCKMVCDHDNTNKKDRA